MSEELKPCPFCKCTELVKVEEQLCRVYCENCWAAGPPMMTLAEAMEQWNRRADDESKIVKRRFTNCGKPKSRTNTDEKYGS